MTEKLCLLSWGEPEDVKLCLVWVNSLKVLSLSKISKSQHLSESAVCVQLAVWGGHTGWQGRFGVLVSFQPWDTTHTHAGRSH